jgi:hypothetical protein
MSDTEGREALSTVHLNVPRALKVRWVKASQAKGLKLTDWLLAQLERAEHMTAYPIPAPLASTYHGAGYALAAIMGSQLVALRYLADVAPELADVLAEGGRIARQAATAWIASDAAGPTVRELQALGHVSVGMCSAWEFVEL